MIKIKELLLQGYSILVVAIIINISLPLIKLNTWYDFINQITRLGLTEAFRQQSILNLLVLFIGYPIALAYSLKLPEVLNLV